MEEVELMAQKALSIGVNGAPIVHGLITSSLFILAECWGVGGTVTGVHNTAKGEFGMEKGDC